VNLDVAWQLGKRPKESVLLIAESELHAECLDGGHVPRLNIEIVNADLDVDDRLCRQAFPSGGPDVFDPSGRHVRALRRGTMPAGVSTVSWDGKLESGRPAPSGIYFLKLRTEDGASMKRVVLLR